MRVDILTLFPGIVSGPLDHSILSKAREAGFLTVEGHDLRDFAAGKHRATKEPPLGGAGGMGNPLASSRDSFEEGLLEAPQYTRPRTFRGRAVPDVLLSGDHAAIEKWRREGATL